MIRLPLVAGAVACVCLATGGLRAQVTPDSQRVLSLLRKGEFQQALHLASDLDRAFPSDASVAAVRGDALWSMGRFEAAEAAYDASLTIDPSQPRARHGRHGRRRSLAARNRFDAALTDLDEALRSTPNDREFHHTRAALLGLQLGGIVGHRFLSKYVVTIDMERSVVGLN